MNQLKTLPTIRERTEKLSESANATLWEIGSLRSQIKGKQEHIEGFSTVHDTDYLLPEIQELEKLKESLKRNYTDQLNELLKLISKL